MEPPAIPPNAEVPADRPAGDDPLRGFAIYRFVRVLCLSPLLAPIAFGAALIGSVYGPVGDFFYAVFLLSAVLTPFLAIAGLVTAVVSGVLDKLSPAISDKMWRLVLVAIAGYGLLYASFR